MKKRVLSTSKKRQAGKQNSFRDPITGQKIVSDVVYGPDSPVSKVYGSDFNSTVEYELGNSVIALTVSGVPREGAPTYATQSINRFVFEGKFAYSANGEVSGRLDRITQGTFYTADYPSGPYEYIDTAALISPRGFNGSSEFRSLILASSPDGSVLTRSAFSFVANPDANIVANRAEEGIPLSFDKSPLASLGLGGFYDGQWWTNPFNGNLL